MKILFISPNFPWPANDGGKIVISNLYNNLLDKGVDIDFLCISKTTVTPDLMNSYNIPENNIFIDTEISSIFRSIYSFFKNQPVLIHKFFNRNFLTAIKNKIKTENYELIHFESLHSVYYALEIVKNCKIPIVLRLHNIESQILARLSDNSDNTFLQWIFRYESKKISCLEKKTFNALKNIIFITEDDLKCSGISNYSNSNPFVLTAGIDVNRFDNIEEPVSTDLIYIGSMDWLPNENAVLWFVKNVFFNIKELFPEIKFYIVGKNPSEKIKKLAGNNIVVTGIVEDVREYINKSGICIVPIFIGGGMRIKILELMAAGRPIISTSIGAEGINYTDGKDIIIANTFTEFIKKILFLINSYEHRYQIGWEAYQNIRNNYSSIKITDEYLAYIEKIIENFEGNVN